MTINFYFEQSITLKQRNRLKLFIASIFRDEKIKAKTISYIFCGDDYLLSINKEFLQHNYYTDIITFDLTEVESDLKIAEIYISTDRVKENAQIQSVSIYQELHRVMFHGILHLCGYQDKTKDQKKKMQAKENHYLKKYGVGNL